MDDLECDLVVFHPYRTLLSLCKKEASASSGSSNSEEGEADDMGAGIDDGPRYWGTGEGQLEFTPPALQTAWYVPFFWCGTDTSSFSRSIINDSYRSQLCLLYPPHLVAIAAIYLTFILHPPTLPEPTPTPEYTSSESSQEALGITRRRSSRQVHNHPPRTVTPKKPQDPIAFLADLNVSLPMVATIAQEIIAMYTLWDRYNEDVSPDAKLARELTNSPMASGGALSASGSPAKRTVSRSESLGGAPTPVDDGGSMGTPAGTEGSHITPAFLSAVLLRMRELRVMETAPSMGSSSSRPVAVNKRLERTQAAG